MAQFAAQPLPPGPNSLYQHAQLRESLTTVFGVCNEEILQLIKPRLEWVELVGGEVLFRQGDRSDTLCFVISGRVLLLAEDANGQVRKVGEVIRGEPVGEMAVFTNEPHATQAVAVRDSLLIKLSKALFEEVLAAHPYVATNVTRLIIARLQGLQRSHPPPRRPENICLLPLHAGVDVAALATALHAQLAAKGPTLLLSGATVDAAMPGRRHAAPNQPDPASRAAYRQFTRWLEEQETQHMYLLYVADVEADEWTRRCLRQADEIVLLADATQPPALTPLERLPHCPYHTQARQKLILLHPAATPLPQGTAAWLNARPTLTEHFHLRSGHLPDVARLARVLSGTAIGLVFSGGGAKGFAHIGVLQALEEAAVAIDFLGGTSTGAITAAAAAFAQPARVVCTTMRQGAFFNPTKDYNLLPFISLLRGRRMQQLISNAIFSMSGHADVLLEDTWLPVFTVASNYTQAREEIHTRGSMTHRLRASTAIPGLFPPVIDGNDLLVDGGMFNNFPVEAMRRRGVGKIIGVDLVADKAYQLTISEIPGPLALLRDRFRSRKNRKYHLPSLPALILNSTVLASSARRRQALRYLDLCFTPSVGRYSITQWKAFDAIADEGYQHARTVLAQLSPEKLRELQG